MLQDLHNRGPKAPRLCKSRSVPTPRYVTNLYHDNARVSVFDILEPGQRWMNEHTLVAAERDIARVDKQRSMRTSLRGGGTTGWTLVRVKSSPLLVARESTRIHPLPV